MIDLHPYKAGTDSYRTRFLHHEARGVGGEKGEFCSERRYTSKPHIVARTDGVCGGSERLKRRAIYSLYVPCRDVVVFPVSLSAPLSVLLVQHQPSLLLPVYSSRSPLRPDHDGIHPPLPNNDEKWNHIGWTTVAKQSSYSTGCCQLGIRRERRRRFPNRHHRLHQKNRPPTAQAVAAAARA